MLYNEHIIRSHCLWAFVIKEQMRESKIPPQKSILLYSKMNSFLPEELDSSVTQKENEFWFYYLTDGGSTYYTRHESLRQQILAVLFDAAEEDFPVLYQLNLTYKREVN